MCKNKSISRCQKHPHIPHHLTSRDHATERDISDTWSSLELEISEYAYGLMRISVKNKTNKIETDCFRSVTARKKYLLIFITFKIVMISQNLSKSLYMWRKFDGHNVIIFKIVKICKIFQNLSKSFDISQNLSKYIKIFQNLSRYLKTSDEH